MGRIGGRALFKAGKGHARAGPSLAQGARRAGSGDALWGGDYFCRGTGTDRARGAVDGLSKHSKEEMGSFALYSPGLPVSMSLAADGRAVRRSGNQENRRRKAD